jgi:hypothetical protein
VVEEEVGGEADSLYKNSARLSSKLRYGVTKLLFPSPSTVF